jgi:hypothetical protein
MRQKQTNRTKNDQGIDFESFKESQKEIEKYSAGIVRIISCNVVTDESNLPKEYTDKYTITGDKYLILEAEKGDSTVKVVLPINSNNSSGDLEFCYKWTGANSIDFLAGKRIPVWNISNDVFRVQKFNTSIFKYIPLSTIKYLIKNNVIYKKIDGQWDIKSGYEWLIQSLIILLFISIGFVTFTYNSNIFTSVLASLLGMKIYEHILSR